MKRIDVHNIIIWGSGEDGQLLYDYLDITNINKFLGNMINGRLIWCDFSSLLGFASGK